jgi:hypothetical protein
MRTIYPLLLSLIINFIWMTTEEKLEWQKIENEIYTAFKDVKLDDGVGYFEAGAIDAYLQPHDLKYQQEKAKDERDDWTKLLTKFENVSLANERHCFMDAKGLRFYLPFLMIRRDATVNSILHFYISENYKREGYLKTKFTETVSLLTKEQKQSIYYFYDFLSKIENSDFWEGYLNSDFDTGEEIMKGFNFMDFIRKQFATK